MVQPSHLFSQDRSTPRSRNAYKKIIDAGTSDPAVFCNLAILYKNSGRIEEALEHYAQALAFEPDDPQIYNNIGNLYREIGKTDEVPTATVKAIEFDEVNIKALQNLRSLASVIKINTFNIEVVAII